MIAAKTLLPEAVSYARQQMSVYRDSKNGEMQPKLEEARRKLERLRKAKHHQIELDFKEPSAGLQLRKKLAKQRTIDNIFDDYARYVHDALTTEDSAFIRVAAVFRGE